MSSILTNNSAMVALQTLKSINSNLNKTQDEISTGKTVATAKDNAAVFAISKVMESDVAGFESLSDSLALGASTVAVASNATNQIGELLTKIKDKVVSSNGENVDRSTIQDEINQLTSQIQGIVGAAQFNGKNLLTSDDTTNVLASIDRSIGGTVSTNNISVNGVDFGTASGTAGSNPSHKNMSISGDTVTGSTTTMILTSNASFLAATEDFTLTVDGTDLTVSHQDLIDEGIIASGAATDEQLNEYLVRAINGTLQDSSKNLGIQGLTATTQADTGTPANSALTLTSTASEALTIAADATNATGAVGTAPAATLAQVNGTINTAATVTLDLGSTAAATAAAGQGVSVTIGDQTISWDAGGVAYAAGAALRDAAVAGLNQAAQDAGIEGFVFAAGTNASEITLQNLDTTSAYDVTLDTSTLVTNPNTGSVSAPSVNAATASTINLDVAGTVSEGDSFTVTIGQSTATYVAGKNETAGDVVRGLQGVLAADGPSGISMDVSYDGATGVASLVIGGDVGSSVSISEASGGTESTGDLYGLSTLDVTTAAGASKALGTIENLIQTNVNAQADFGSAESRIELQQDFMSSLIDSFKSGIGSLVDADMEEASARLQALQVQQQLATQALSIANQAPQNLLSLFR